LTKNHSDSIFPLFAGLIFAVGLHVAAAAGYALYQHEPPKPTFDEPKPQPRPEPKLPEPEPAPEPDRAAALPDLAVLSLDVAEPRYTNQPVPMRLRLADLGAAVTQPIEVAVLLDGQPLLSAVVNDSMSPGDVRELTRDILVEQPGEHTLTVHVDPRELIDDARRDNNTLTRRFTWQADADRVPLGQLKSQAVDINLITYDDFQKLIAERAKFDQAVVQKSAPPDPTARQAPTDPTPPAPTPSPDQPAPVAAVMPLPQPIAPKRIDQPSPKPDQPARRNPSEQPENVAAGLPDRPELPRHSDTTPMNDKPAEPTDIAARGPDAKLPEPITDDTPAEKPVAAPTREVAPSREVAMATLPTPDAATGREPIVPTPDPDHPAKDKVVAKAPPIMPDPAADPTDKSTKIEADKLPQPAPPTPAGKPDAPKSPKPPADKPAEKAEQMKDGSEPEPPLPDQPQAPQQQAPAQPRAAEKPRPTAAPKDEREAPPVSRNEGFKVQPGQVVARQGLEVRTAVPRFSIVALASTRVNTNPLVELTFDKAGKVIAARFVRGTGFDNIDGPILASLYRWTAVGDALDRVDDQFTIQIKILLVPEP
jgi:hypothetical protein